MQNIEGVDIVFDGDQAGQDAAEGLKILADKVGLVSRNVNLGANIDPGGLGQTQVQNLRNRLYSS
jgi:hypothetical protein